MKKSIRKTTTARIAAYGLALLPVFASVHANVDTPSPAAEATAADTATVFIVQVSGKG